MSNETQGITFPGLLTVLFVGLKLAHVIDWSWWLVLSPTLGSIALVVLVGIVGAVIEVTR